MVFELFRALEPAEKRSLRRYLQNQPIMLRLFDQLGNHPKRIRLAPPAQRHRLHRTMLEGLVQLDSGHTAEARLLRLSAEAEALARRGLIAQARKILERAVALAKDHEALFCMPLLNHRLHELERATFYAGLSEDDVDQTEKEEEETLLDLESINAHRSALKRVYLRLHAEGNARTQEDRQRIAALEDQSAKAIMPSCREARLFDRSRRFQLAYYKGDFGLAAEIAHQQRMEMESAPTWKGDHAAAYIAALNNEMLSSANAGKQNEIPVLLEKLNALDVGTRYLRAQVFMVRMNRGMSYHLQTQQDKAGIELESELDEGLRRYHDLVPQSLQAIFRFNLTCLLFWAGHFQKASDRLQRLIDTPPSNQDVAIAARLLDLVLRRALKQHNSLAESRYRTLVRTLSSKEQRYQLESQVMHVIRQWIFKPRDIPAWQKALAQMGDWLSAQRNEGVLDPMLRGFDWVRWWEGEFLQFGSQAVKHE